MMLNGASSTASGMPATRKCAQLWLETREWSLDELRDILRMLDVKMDVWFYESEVDEPSKAIVDELIQKGIAEDERPQGGPVIVKIDEKLGLTKEKYRTAVILRSDGTSLYLTKDLALAKVKFEQYHVDRSIYVVDFRQSLHFEQAFKILELWGFPQAAKCYHLSYGFVTLPEGSMSARRGRVVLFMDVVDEAVKRVLAVESEKAPDLSAGAAPAGCQPDRSGRPGLFHPVGGQRQGHRLRYGHGPELRRSHRAVYSKCACARHQHPQEGRRISAAAAEFDYDLNAHEVQLIEIISRFPETVQQAADEYRPLVMANYVYDLANAFHSFYHAVPVIQAEDAGRPKRTPAAGCGCQANHLQRAALCWTFKRRT